MGVAVQVKFFELPDQIKVRNFAKSINPILNKADKLASKGPMRNFLLPSSEMRAAMKDADIVAKQTERKALKQNNEIG